MNSQVANLRAYAQSNYATGGSWVVETFEDADYEKYLSGGFKKAKADLKAYWLLMEELADDARFA